MAGQTAREQIVEDVWQQRRHNSSKY